MISAAFGPASAFVIRSRTSAQDNPVAAQALIVGCGGDVLDVPIARRHVVLWLAAKGWSVTRIAARLHMTAGSVRRYIRENSRT